MKALCVLLLVATSAAGQCQDGWCPQPQYYTPPQRQPQRQPQVAPEYEPRPNVTENPPPAKPPSELKPCECGPKWAEITAWQATIVADFKAQLASRDEKIASLEAALIAQAAAVARVESNITNISGPKPDELAGEVAKRLTHSAEWIRLDGRIEKQTRPLTEPLRFQSERVGIK